MSTRALGVRGARQLLDRLLETPDLARTVQALEPRILHRLVRTCGLEDCGEIVALASTERLVRLFDDDLWRSDAPGEEERFDAGRFGLWLEVLADVDAAVAARKLVEMDLDFVAAALTRHVLVLGPGSPGGRAAELAGLEESDPDETARAARVEQAVEDGVAHDFAGCQVVARSAESWVALLAVLVALDADHHAFFTRLMRRCHRISIESLDEGSRLDSILDPEAQMLADVAADRERRREEEGYVAPSDAAAFLELARRSPHPREGAAPDRDPVSAAWFRERAAGAKSDSRSGRAKTASAEPQHAASPAPDVASFVATLQQAGVLPRPRPPLLQEGPGAGGSRLSRLRAQLLFVREHDPAVHSRRLEEIGLRVARRLAETLSDLSCDDAEVQADIAELSRRLETKIAAATPWHVRDQLDVLAVLDQVSWAILLALLDECPVLPKAAEEPTGGPRPLRVSEEFEFIAENVQIARVHAFAESLPSRLV